MANWPRIAGLRVVMSWPDTEFAPQRAPRGQARSRLAGLLGISLIAGGALAIALALAAQVHPPAPTASAAGTTGHGGAKVLLRKSLPVSVAIPAIGVRSRLLHLGLNPDGTIEVPSLLTSAGEAAWYKYSAPPGQPGTAVIEGHVDSYHGPAVFFRLGALRPGNRIEVTLADGATAVFQVTGVREYSKEEFPAKTVYGQTRYPALRLITCGGDFDPATGHYLSSVVVFAVLSTAKS